MSEGRERIQVLQDEVERLRAQVEELEQHKQWFREMVEGLPDGYFETDMKGCITFSNEAMANALGYRPEEFLQVNVDGIFPSPAERARARVNFRRVYTSGVSLRAVEQRLCGKDGAVKTFTVSLALRRDRNGTPTGFYGICRDITTRKQIEEENLRYREFIENISDGCWEVDLRGNHTFVNNAMCVRHGYSREEMIGANYRQFIRPTNVAQVRKVYNEIYKTGQSRVISDYEMIGKQGQSSYLELSVSLIRDPEGNPRGFRGVSRDITERKRFENKIIQSQKFEAITTLAAGIAHTFNNALMGIQGNVALLLLDMDRRDEKYLRLRNIEEQIKYAADLTQQLLAYAHIAPAEMKPLQINSILERATALIALVKREVRIRRYLAPNLRLVQADAGQMEQVFMNLFINAGEAMKGGGTITVTTDEVTLSASDAERYELAAGDYVRIRVADTGCGMDEETVKRVFDPFFTTKALGQGTGLGLAAAYGIVKGHGGAMEASSVVGKGTTFTIYLPLIATRPRKSRRKGSARRRQSP